MVASSATLSSCWVQLGSNFRASVAALINICLLTASSFHTLSCSSASVSATSSPRGFERELLRKRTYILDYLAPLRGNMQKPIQYNELQPIVDRFVPSLIG